MLLSKACKKYRAYWPLETLLSTSSPRLSQQPHFVAALSDELLKGGRSVRRAAQTFDEVPRRVRCDLLGRT